MDDGFTETVKPTASSILFILDPVGRNCSLSLQEGESWGRGFW